MPRSSVRPRGGARRRACASARRDRHPRRRNAHLLRADRRRDRLQAQEGAEAAVRRLRRRSHRASTIARRSCVSIAGSPRSSTAMSLRSAAPRRLPCSTATASPSKYAVAMRAFTQDDLLAVMLEQGTLGREHVDEFAREVAAFHARIASAAAGSSYGAPGRVLADAMENFRRSSRRRRGAPPHAHRARDWTQDAFRRARPQSPIVATEASCARATAISTSATPPASTVKSCSSTASSSTPGCAGST